jgi:hypothetical protein
MSNDRAGALFAVMLWWSALGTDALAHRYKSTTLEIVHPWIMETSGPTARFP